jgi:hypothetical protein
MALQRFWTMLAHCHGRAWKATDPARAHAVSESTVRRYLDLLTDGFMVRQLHPFHANIRKRQIKAPKIYVRDSGLLHQLLGISSMAALLSHPKAGASWEGFVIEQVLLTESHDEAYFWGTHQGAEIDLILRRNGGLVGVECKRRDTPRVTPSIRHALDDLGLERVVVIYPGHEALSAGRSGRSRAAARARRHRIAIRRVRHDTALDRERSGSHVYRGAVVPRCRRVLGVGSSCVSIHLLCG